mmetsp:Transcript_22071/g.37893  ORF Transcript_22071/g.37893 Transcript_22071/m.37893 type:complete len:212 (+) Transcript_22071:669-1304(+)
MPLPLLRRRPPRRPRRVKLLSKRHRRSLPKRSRRKSPLTSTTRSSRRASSRSILSPLVRPARASTSLRGRTPFLSCATSKTILRWAPPTRPRPLRRSKRKTRSSPSTNSSRLHRQKFPAETDVVVAVVVAAVAEAVAEGHSVVAGADSAAAPRAVPRSPAVGRPRTTPRTCLTSPRSRPSAWRAKRRYFFFALVASTVGPRTFASPSTPSL